MLRESYELVLIVSPRIIVLPANITTTLELSAASGLNFTATGLLVLFELQLRIMSVSNNKNTDVISKKRECLIMTEPFRNIDGNAFALCSDNILFVMSYC